MVQALKGDYDWSINSIILGIGIKVLVPLFYFVDFDYILKALNRQAHVLAKLCYSARQDVAFLPF